ncbi:MAG: TRAP transporter small permease subunit [Oscillospiraceae bacterium]|nr:TRAP transporter small permease subunit [Oscillospiraceae bacterium]
MKTLEKICAALDKFFMIFFYISGAILFVLLVVAFFVVMARQLFDYSPIWSDEMQRFLMVGMVFFAIPYMTSAKTFLVVDLTAIFFGKHEKFHRVMLIIGEIMVFGFMVYLVFPCIQLVQNTKTFSAALRMPMAAMYGLMPMSFAFGALGMLKNIVKTLFVEPHMKKEEVQ